jgi:hypothetical protein
MKEFTVKTNILQELAFLVFGLSMIFHSFQELRHHAPFLWLLVGGLFFIGLVLQNFCEIKKQVKRKQKR